MNCGTVARNKTNTARAPGKCSQEQEQEPGPPGGQNPTMNETLVVPLPPMLSVATRLAPSTW
jgi:hypothetical protein